jgi:hypothetical protein
MHAGAATFTLGAASPTVATHAIASAVAAAPAVAGCPLDSASAADQTVIAVVASIWFSIGCESSAVGAVGVRSVWPGAMWARAPRVVTVVVATVPASVADVGIVVENDGTPASPETPVAVPRIPTPAKATDSAKHSESSEGGAQGYAGAK